MYDRRDALVVHGGGNGTGCGETDANQSLLYFQTPGRPSELLLSPTDVYLDTDSRYDVVVGSVTTVLLYRYMT